MFRGTFWHLFKLIGISSQCSAMLCRNPLMIFYFKSLQTDVTRHTCSGVALRLHDERQENLRFCSFAMSWKIMIKANIWACNFSVGWFYYHGSGPHVTVHSGKKLSRLGCHLPYQLLMCLFQMLEIIGENQQSIQLHSLQDDLFTG